MSILTLLAMYVGGIFHDLPKISGLSNKMVTGHLYS